MGGGGGGISGYNYRAAIMAGLCNGPIAGIGAVWSNKDRTTLADLQMTFSRGDFDQALWGYIETKHPEEAVNYPGLAYIASPELYLGRSSAELPNLSFEVFGRGMYKTVLDYGGDPVWATPELVSYLTTDEETGIVIAVTLVARGGAGFGHSIPFTALVIKFEFTGPPSLSGTISDTGQTFVATSGETITLDGGTITQIDLVGDGTHSISLTAVYIATEFTQEVAVYSSSVSGRLDADPAEVITDFLTAAVDGAGIDPSLLADLTAYSDYCRSANLLISPCFAEQKPAADHLKDILLATNSEAVPSQGLLKIIPYGDLALAGNGSTFTPDVTPLYTFDDDHFLASGEDPVTGSRITSADAFNHVQVEFINRAKDYNTEIAEKKDQADIESEVGGIKKGLRTRDTIQLHCICDPEVAGIVAQLLLQRSLYIRNTYRFKLSWNYCLLEPMDIIALTDEALGLFAQPCRIRSIEEDEDDRLEFEVEEIIPGISTAETYAQQVAAGYIGDTTVAPGDATAPIIFEPPEAICSSPDRPEVWISSSGGPSWGGCEVWISTNGETYASIGFLYGKSRMGILASSIASGGATDTTHTLDVDVSESGAIIYPGNQQDVDTLQTLCYVDGELIAFRDAVLTAANRYALTYLKRGAYGTAIASHSAGAQFVRLDKQVLHFPYPATLIGKTIDVKLTSFNVYGRAQQSLADATTYSFAVTGGGLAVKPHTESGVNLATTLTALTVTYARTFTGLPAVSITVTDMAAGDVVVFDDQQVGFFSFHITNAGSAVVRHINWIAQGV